METLVFSNRKGGVGKTTSCAAVTSGLSKKTNKETGMPYRVLAIDMDSQANLSQCFGIDINNSFSSYHVLAQDKTASEVIQKTSQGDIIPGSPMLDVAKQFTQLSKYFLLKNALKEIEDEYDVACIDTSCDILNNTATICSFVAADKVIVPLEADPYAIQGLAELTHIIKDIKEIYNPKLEIAGLLLTRFETVSTLSREIKSIIEEMSSILGAPVFDTYIRKNTTLKDAASVQKSIFTFNSRSAGSIDYNNFCDELIAKGVV